MTILGPSAVARSLPMATAVGVMRKAFAAHARQQVQSPPRTVLRTGKGRGATLVMPASTGSDDSDLLAVKVVSVFPENPRRGLRAIHGTVVVSDAGTGVPLALLDGVALTAIRTAAACGLATDLLARSDSRVLAVFGSGVHARTQVEAMRTVRPIKDIRIYNPNTRSAEAMAAGLSRLGSARGEIRAVGSPAEALDGADVACMATTSRVPVFQDCEVPDGLHINAIGAFKPEDREVPGATVGRSLVVVDDLDSAMEEAGDLLIAIEERKFSREAIHADIGSLVLGRAGGRSDPSQVTFFKSDGIAAQDVFAAQAVLREAERLRLGDRIDW